ncbi:PAS domain-containing sensor histidine kinase [Bacillus kwashiorkori]|uniref:PAS domain-containing sensor histidine kinase n=1 Tax=Bacillus kwashiorkori TaxID=1522318 RepID=UPI0007853E80|nr:PAS domain-containing sensor histidine kinase [Bacillus kwashiorkori]
MSTFHLEEKYLRQIFESIQDGIIIMDENRKILLMNPAAKRLTGWHVDQHVPYCSYCETRELKPCENKCYLIENDEIPYFLSQMPTYHGNKINVEMSTALMYPGEDSSLKEYLLVLRDQDIKQKEEEAKLSKQMIQKLIEAKETEHKRLAQELHDGVNQSLYTISVALQAIETFVTDKRLLDYVNEVREELESVMNDVKAYAYQLRPQSLDRLGLVATIQSVISTLENSHANLRFSFTSNLSERLPATVEINLYRVFQEAVHNIIKYANATQVQVQLLDDPRKITLTIKDNGIGFQPQVYQQKGLGLKHMEERMDQIGGTFRILSETGIGTTITGYVPKGEGFLD